MIVPSRTDALVAQNLRPHGTCFALRILPPPGDGWSTNNRSVGILLEYGAFRALFTGYSEREERAWFLAQGIPGVTLLKAAHHGALNGVNPGWVQATRPEVVYRARQVVRTDPAA